MAAGGGAWCGGGRGGGGRDGVGRGAEWLEGEKADIRGVPVEQHFSKCLLLCSETWFKNLRNLLYIFSYS